MRISKLIFLLFISSAFIYGADESEKILSKLQNKYESVKDISANFTQDVTYGISKMQQKIEGSIRIKKGNKYRIELEKQTIVTDGKTVWSYSHINNQVIIDKFKDDPKSLSPDHVLINVPKNYNSIFIGNETLLDKKTSIVKLTPKDDKSLVKFMKVWVDLDEYLMRKIEIVDVSDNVNIYLIKSIKLNTGIPDDTFKFEIPKGVEKVDLR
jgi:outer membrane lipoprotein carrier protein